MLEGWNFPLSGQPPVKDIEDNGHPSYADRLRKTQLEQQPTVWKAGYEPQPSNCRHHDGYESLIPYRLKNDALSNVGKPLCLYTRKIRTIL